MFEYQRIFESHFDPILRSLLRWEVLSGYYSLDTPYIGVHLEIIDPRSIDQRRTETSDSTLRIMHQSRPRYRQLHPPRISTSSENGRLDTHPPPPSSPASLSSTSHPLWTTFRSLSPKDLPVTEEDKEKEAGRGLKGARAISKITNVGEVPPPECWIR